MRELSWILWPTKACTQPRKALQSFSVRSRKSSQGAVDLLPITPQLQGLVESQMCRDNETTAVQLHKPLCHHGRNISPSTILRSRLSLGWTFRGSAYCQMIYQENKVKCLAFARVYLHEAEGGFADVVWTDQTSVQLETHSQFCCRKRPRHKPK